MSKSPDRPSHRKTDRTAAVTLEVPSGVADDIEAVLCGYAEEAELDTALVVDHSGYLIAGISSLPDVDVDTIGALVAGAGTATEGLTGALGEEGRVESLHLGEDRLMYLKDVGERFILVGVSDSNIPAGILRDQASLIEPALLKQLAKVKAVPMSLTRKKSEAPTPEPPKPERPRSLRQPEPERPQARPPAPKPNGTAKRPETVSGSIRARDGAVGGVIPGSKAETEKAKPDPVPGHIFEVDEAETPSQETVRLKKEPASIENKKVEPRAIVENSPFEMDDEDDDFTSFKPARPNTTPVHLSVPAARQREAAARKECNEEEEDQSDTQYSYELG